MRRILLCLTIVTLAGCRQPPALVIGSEVPAPSDCECATGWQCCPGEPGVCVRDLAACPTAPMPEPLPRGMGDEFSAEAMSQTDYGVWQADTAFNSGVFLVAWQSQQKGLLAARYSRSGDLLDAAPLKVAPNEMRGSSLRVVPSGEGFAIVWVGAGGNFGMSLYGAFIDASGTVRGPFGGGDDRAPTGGDCQYSVLERSVVVSCVTSSGGVDEKAVDVRESTWRALTNWEPAALASPAVAPAQHVQTPLGTYGARLTKAGDGLLLEVIDDDDGAVLWSTPVPCLVDNAGQLVTAARNLFSFVGAGEDLVLVYREDTGPFWQPGAVGRIKAVSLRPASARAPLRVTGPVELLESAPVESAGPTVRAKNHSVWVGLKNVLSMNTAVPFVRELAADTLEPGAALECNDDLPSTLPYGFAGVAFDAEGQPLVLAGPSGVGNVLVAKVPPGSHRAEFVATNALMGNTTAQSAPTAACLGAQCITTWVDARSSVGRRTSVRAMRATENTPRLEGSFEVFAVGDAIAAVATKHELLVATIDSNPTCEADRPIRLFARAVPAAGELSPAQTIELEHVKFCTSVVNLAATAVNDGALFAVLSNTREGQPLSIVYRDSAGHLGEVAAPTNWVLRSPTQVSLAATAATALVVVKNSDGTLATALVEFDDTGAPHLHGVLTAQPDLLAATPALAPIWGRLIEDDAHQWRWVELIVNDTGPGWSLKAWQVAPDGHFAEHTTTLLTTSRGLASNFAVESKGTVLVTERAFSTDPSDVVVHQLSWSRETLNDRGRVAATGVDASGALGLAEAANGWLVNYSRTGWKVPTPYGFVPPRVFGRFVYGP